MSLKLSPMTEETFDQYYKNSMIDYANEHVKAGNWKEEDAVIKAQQQFGQLLPEGLATKEHVLFSILHDEESIGILWLHTQLRNQEKQAFIYDIELDDVHRGKGFGKATMAALEEYAQSKGIKQLGLHVFAHNQAISLYEKMGFEMTDHHMLKRLS